MSPTKTRYEASYIREKRQNVIENHGEEMDNNENLTRNWKQCKCLRCKRRRRRGCDSAYRVSTLTKRWILHWPSSWKRCLICAPSTKRLQKSNGAARGWRERRSEWKGDIIVDELPHNVRKDQNSHPCYFVLFRCSDMMHVVKVLGDGKKLRDHIDVLGSTV